ncbi:DUF7683 domain-containing protein [Algoriphagus litoralis]
MDFVRQIDVFDNLTELLVDELPLASLDLDVLKRRFNVTTDDLLMYNSYEISTMTADLFPFVNFDFNKFSYFLGCYQA